MEDSIIVTSFNHSKNQLEEVFNEFEVNIRMKKKEGLVKALIYYSGHGCCDKDNVKSRTNLIH